MLKADTVNFNQLDAEQRWDVQFNIEVKSLSSNHINFKTIEEISEHITNGATPLGANFPETGVNFYKANDIKKFTFDFIDHNYIRPEESAALKRSILQPEDIIFTIKGKVGDIAVFPKGLGESNINQDNALIRLKPEYDPYYFTAVFNSKFGFNQIKAFATETMNPFLGLGNLKKLKIPFLEKEDMENISNHVKKTMDNELESLRLIKEAQNLFYNALNIQFKEYDEIGFSTNLEDFIENDLWIPKYNYPLYTQTLSQIEEKVETIPLGNISETVSGDEVGRNNYIKYIDRTEKDIPFIRTSDIINYGVDLYPDFYIPLEFYDGLKQDIKSKDILYTKDGKIGACGMLTENDKIIIGSGIARIRINELAQNYNITPEYLFLILSLKETGLYPAIRRTVVASTIPHLRINRLNEFEIPILNQSISNKLTDLITKSFKLKNDNKLLIKKIMTKMDTKLN